MKKVKPHIVSYKDKKVKLFLIFLALSFFFWFLSKLSKEYTTTISFKTEFINQPKEKTIFTDKNLTLNITLKSSGFDLLKNTFKKRIKIDLSDVKETNGKIVLNPNDQITKIQEQLGNNIQIIHIEPEILKLDFGTLNTKKIKVIPNLSLNYKSGYYLSEPLKIIPDSIAISGPKEIIDTIRNIYTKELKLTDLDNDFNQTVLLKKNWNNKIKYNTEKIHISGKVEKNTEGEIILPIYIINTKGKNVKTFEKNIKAKYKVSLKNYDKVKASDFKIICDYNRTKKDSLDYLIPEIQKKSEYVTEVEIHPKKIEFLILE